MNTRLLFFLLLVASSMGCSSLASTNAVFPDGDAHDIGHTPHLESSPIAGQWTGWGFYDLEIGADGSYSYMKPHRDANAKWGYHLNVVKLLETSPCTNCIWLSNVHKLDNGDISVDISIKHPYDNAAYTGFDVRGIIMFPASQYFADNDLRAIEGLEPMAGWKHRFSSAVKGDAILVNTEGWTSIWAPEYGDWGSWFWLEEGYPIFEYYPGKLASGTLVGTLNPFKRFYSSENRHMFEASKTVTRTYVIRPPATGPILASYAVYAHWAEPLKIPVTDPMVDFPPEANSTLPYEWYVYQDDVIDPDAPDDVNAQHIFYHYKTWPHDDWQMGGWLSDLAYTTAIGGEPIPDPVKPDEYHVGFYAKGFCKLPAGYADKLTYIFRIELKDTSGYPYFGASIMTDWYILDVEFSQVDGQW